MRLFSWNLCSWKFLECPWNVCELFLVFFFFQKSVATLHWDHLKPFLNRGRGSGQSPSRAADYENFNTGTVIKKIKILDRGNMKNIEDLPLHTGHLESSACSYDWKHMNTRNADCVGVYFQYSMHAKVFYD